MRSICLNFEVSKPSFDFSVSTIDEEELNKLNAELANQLVNNYYSKITAIISEIISEFGSLVKFDFNISASTIEYYKEFAPSFIEQISNLDSRSIGFNKSISNISSFQKSSLFSKEISRQHNTILDNFGATTTNLIYLGSYLSQDIVNNCKDIDGLIIKKTLNSISSNYVLEFDENNKILQADREFNSMFIDQKVSMSKIIAYLNDKPEAAQFVNLDLNYSDFIDNEMLFDKLRELPEKVMSKSNFTFNSSLEIVNYADLVQGKTMVDIPVSIYDILNNNEIFKLSKKQFEQISDLYKENSGLVSPSFWQEMRFVDLYTNFDNGFYLNSIIKSYLKPYKNTKVSTLVHRKMLLLEEFIEEQLEQDFLKNSKYRFADLETMPKIKLKKLLINFDAGTIFYAIHGQNDKLKDKVLSNISLRVLSSIEELMEIPSSEISLIEVRNAKRRILSKLKKM